MRRQHFPVSIAGSGTLVVSCGPFEDDEDFTGFTVIFSAVANGNVTVQLGVFDGPVTESKFTVASGLLGEATLLTSASAVAPLFVNPTIGIQPGQGKYVGFLFANGGLGAVTAGLFVGTQRGKRRPPLGEERPRTHRLPVRAHEHARGTGEVVRAS